MRRVSNNIEAKLDMANFKTNLAKTIIDDGKANSNKGVIYVEIFKEKLNNLDMKTNISNVNVNEGNGQGRSHVVQNGTMAPHSSQIFLN